MLTEPPEQPRDGPSISCRSRPARLRNQADELKSRDISSNQVVGMKVKNSLKSLRARHRDNRLVRRKGRLYVINKTQKRFKARQG